MLEILGAGHAYPASVLDDSLLAGLGGSAPAVPGIVSRLSTLPIDYIKSSRNADPFAGKAAALQTPSDLAAAAAEMALQRAGIGWDRIGLIVGDSCTPLQTTPAEGQRLGGKAGLKIPAYDMSGGTATLALHLRSFLAFDSGKLPEYVLCFSSCTPTQLVDYRSGTERSYFGDAAGAVVLSKKHRGKFRVRAAEYQVDIANRDRLSLPLYSHIHFKNFDASEPQRALEGIARKCAEAHACAGAALRQPETKTRGMALGATGFCTLSAAWDEAHGGEIFCIPLAGPDVSYGALLLEAGK